MNIGDRVREIRLAQGLTLRGLADRADLTLNGIGRIERGEREPSASTIIKLAQAFDVQPGELFPPKEQSRSSTDIEGRRLNAGMWINLLNVVASDIEKRLPASSKDLDIREARGLDEIALEFWFTYKFTTRKRVRAWTLPDQLEMLTQAETRMREALRAASRLFSAKFEQQRSSLSGAEVVEFEQFLNRALREERLGA
jgi:transcriptional regulator with XRE-family HTH domain